MAKTLVGGLELIEDLGLYGPMTISELARRSGVHVSIVSRTVAMLEPEGWMVRVDGKIAAGPRCALLGLISPAGKTVRRAESLVKAPAIHCIAAPWPTSELPASLACIGSREEIDTNRTTIEACLRAPIRPGAGAQDVFDIAARGPDK